MNKTIADEICTCGHSKLCHKPHTLDKHGGECNQCECYIYTWHHFVFAEDLIKQAKSSPQNTNEVKG